ncbi:hypothetical protein HOLleu_38390 [Holothuria leucospilota]|uniref:Uncharacterized protein n=1 Tax=Holothuria leucospilota TaxID=206669 RepID=A0A9Q1BDI8_HOLLE|nr:hypothetical protein HOLleu_38390 [Holothuria leucospilota]
MEVLPRTMEVLPWTMEVLLYLGPWKYYLRGVWKRSVDMGETPFITVTSPTSPSKTCDFGVEDEEFMTQYLQDTKLAGSHTSLDSVGFEDNDYVYLVLQPPTNKEDTKGEAPSDDGMYRKNQFHLTW